MGMWRGSGNGEGMFAYELFEKNLIGEATFSMRLDTNVYKSNPAASDAASFIDFGEPNIAAMRNRNDLVWIPNLPNQNYWANTVTGFKWGYSNDESTFPINPEKIELPATTAILDSGWYDIIGPTAQVDLIREKICSKVGLSGNCNAQATFVCDTYLSQLPSFYLEYGNYWFEVQADHYIEKATDHADTNCKIRIETDDSLGYWKLGLAFMQGWYTIHEYDGNRMGFVAHTDSTKTVPSCTTVAACKFT